MSVKKSCLNIFLLFVGVIGFIQAEEGNFQFAGRHFIASYLDCSEAALSDNKGIRQAMLQAIAACGATLLGQSDYEFKPSGITMVALLSESHASIHTYPEHRACFVDLFTCGHRCSAEAFDAVLRKYLCPGQVDSRILLRDQSIHEP